MDQAASIITPSHSGDFESCRLLCESIDRYVSGLARHYIIVNADELGHFRPLAGTRRVVIDGDALLAHAFWPLPAWLKWRGRRRWFGLGCRMPITGWHLQQMRKIAMTMAQPNSRVICVDSDNCFIRPVDLAALAGGDTVPLYSDPGGVNRSWPQHVVWWTNAHRLLGLDVPELPGDDFIGQMIVWDKAAVVAMTERIVRTTGRPWQESLAHTRQFAEYMLYGVAVSNDAELMRRHVPVHTSACLAYWKGPALDAAGLETFTTQLRPDHRAIAIQSFTGTPVEVIRAFALSPRA
jgi:hypothetical protein